ncbi:MAG: N-acetyl-gamma-glutamyl-phosphate reductase [Deltaproteobacteria bacterium]
MKRVGIVGAKGYGGEELIRLLLGHPGVRLTYLADRLEKPEPITQSLPQFAGRVDLLCENYDAKTAAGRCDLVFLALPHKVSMTVAPGLAALGVKVIDLSADYRLRADVYAAHYKTPQSDPANLKKAVYGLPELYRQKIKKASFIANPGCYPTAAVLGIAPALSAGLVDADDIVIDAKSGATGAGKKADVAFSFTELYGDFKGYRFLEHQHAPEIDQQLSRLADRQVRVAFCPHLLPVRRGIYETIYLKAKKAVTLEKVHRVYAAFYKTEPFVRVRSAGTLPQLKHVVDTNFCDIGCVVGPDRRRLVIVSAIDNLLKGASGQAVQNMNLMFGLPETTALL